MAAGYVRHTWSIESVTDFFLDRGCVLLETEYINSNTKMRYIATCGHEHSISLDNFRAGKGILCEKCRRANNAQKESLGEQVITEFFEAEGCPVTQPADRTNKKVKYIAHCGHENEMTYNHFRFGGGRVCRICSKSVQYQIDYVREAFEQEDCELLEAEYINCKTPMRYIAQCGHESMITFDTFLNAPNAPKRCKNCHKRTYHEIPIDRNKPASKEWRKNVYKKDNWTCQACGCHGGNLNAHHLDAYDANPEKRFDISNGVTLCPKCHIRFHKMYGFGGNTSEQFYEWIRNFNKAFNNTFEHNDKETKKYTCDQLYHSLAPLFHKEIIPEELYWALNQLDFSQRKRIAEHYIDGVAMAKIAEQEGVSLQAVYQSIARALNRLKKILKIDQHVQD